MAENEKDFLYDYGCIDSCVTFERLGQEILGLKVIEGLSVLNL